jgi:xanthine/uracil/vitamin C permease (AzgA family)
MERLFKLSANQTTVRTEVLAGVTTFLTMAYIIVVQPAVLSGKNVRHGYGPGVWCRHYSEVYFSGAGNRDHGTLRALCHRTGAYPPITAPALTIVGAMMMQNVAKIEWKDYTESIPAFLITVGIPFSYSIADGLALGFISYAIVKGFSGRARGIGWLTYLLAIVLVVYFVFVRSRIG